MKIERDNIIKDSLVNVFDAMDGSQALDGYSALANFREIVGRVKGLLEDQESQAEADHLINTHPGY